jgi:hypothetical protein
VGPAVQILVQTWSLGRCFRPFCTHIRWARVSAGGSARSERPSPSAVTQAPKSHTHPCRRREKTKVSFRFFPFDIPSLTQAVARSLSSPIALINIALTPGRRRRQDHALRTRLASADARRPPKPSSRFDFVAVVVAAVLPLVSSAALSPLLVVAMNPRPAPSCPPSSSELFFVPKIFFRYS